MTQAAMNAIPEDDGRPWVMVVDDSRVIRRTILSVLRQTYNVLEAENGAAGWSALRHNSRVELIISDIEMPELDGYGFICKIRASEDPGLREIPIVVITSADDDITRERAYACGANDFILKPFNANQLMSCVQNQINEYRSANGVAPMQTSAPAAAAQPVANAAPVAIADTGPGTVETALEYIDKGFGVLRGLKTASFAPHALSLVLRFMPLLKYCNAKFNLDMDREIAVFQQRVAAARDAEVVKK
ncbi:MAG TPA: response regulator [Burkholderiales bacterium]|nr:response regulator [Burkholderiales bacterium]